MDRNKYYGGESASMTPLEEVRDSGSSFLYYNSINSALDVIITREKFLFCKKHKNKTKRTMNL